MSNADFAYLAAQEAVDNGELDVAMGLLAKCDEEDPEGYRMLTTRVRHQIAALREVASSAGTNSSTSASTLDSSGSSPQETESSLPSPVQDAESHSSKDPAQSPALSSTADSTGGSTQETGPSQPSQPASSEEKQSAADPVTESTGDEPTPAEKAADLIGRARAAYDEGSFDVAESLLDEADKADPSVTTSTALARQAIKLARAQR